MSTEGRYPPPLSTGSVTGQCIGHKLIAQGVQLDNLGQPIDPGLLYNYSRKGLEPLKCWRLGTLPNPKRSK